MAREDSPHFLIAGEALVDLLQQPDGTLLPKLGGSPWNLARALGRLGCKVEYINPLSTDDFGQRLEQELCRSQVKIGGSRSFAPTSLALVKVGANGQPDYAFYREGVADRDVEPMSLAKVERPNMGVFHVGSLSLLPPDGEAWGQLLVAFLAQGVCTSIDINMRPMAAKDRHAYALLARALVSKGVIVKVSEEDLRYMALGGEPLDEARGLLSGHTQVVVLTMGQHGAWCLTKTHEYHQKPSKVQVVDAVGAGDCFYAGFLSMLAELGCLDSGQCKQPDIDVIERAMAFGSRVAVWNLQQTGCQPPWRHEL